MDPGLTGGVALRGLDGDHWDMLSRAIWRGSISFGLVNIGVRLYPATRHLDVRFRELDRATGQRLRHQRVRLQGPGEDAQVQPFAAPGPTEPGPSSRPETGDLREARRASEQESEGSPPFVLSEGAEASVPITEVVKGFEFERNRYVTVSAAELESLAPERSRTIDVEQFVGAAEVDPVYFDTSYYLVPDLANVRSFTVLLEGMRDTGRLGLGWIVLRRKRHLAAVREHGRLMVLTTMFHADEVLPAQPLEPPLPEELSPRERDMARLLIETLSGPFEPERYRDQYRERLLGLLEERASPERTPVAEAEAATSATGIEDLMAALQASVERARRQKAEKSAPAPRTARRGRRGA
jgi:DNA end-binding protein Ku